MSRDHSGSSHAAKQQSWLPSNSAFGYLAWQTTSLGKSSQKDAALQMSDFRLNCRTFWCNSVSLSEPTCFHGDGEFIACFKMCSLASSDWVLTACFQWWSHLWQSYGFIYAGWLGPCVPMWFIIWSPWHNVQDIHKAASESPASLLTQCKWQRWLKICGLNKYCM